MGAERNYARFYSLLKKLPGADKETLVEQYTNGRTVHLHRTTMQEYNKMCNDMEQVAGYDERMHRMHEALRKARSGALHQMQLYGIDTADWTRVNAFCRDPRIAGKEFRKLDVEELNALNTKMRTIIRKQKSNQ
ncbi:hypothetical protein [Segatella buccae]|uniref:hypothetical protein n=1 Tax=Segatella buccae TaxID=28126 RepID=UPI003FD8F845